MKVPLDPAFLRIPIAHRGLHDIRAGRPENSRAAVRAAIDAGYGVEIDIQRSSDDQAMVFHDYDLGRLTRRKGPVSSQSARELADIPLKGGNENVPTLREILEIVEGRVPLLIEIKDQDRAMGPAIGPLEAAVAVALEGYEGPVAVMSFNPHAVAEMMVLAPHVARGLTTSAFLMRRWPELPPGVRRRLRGIPDLEAVDGSFISHDRRDLDRRRVAEIRSAGYPVLSWTVRSPEEEAQARRFADNITFEGYLPAIPS